VTLSSGAYLGEVIRRLHGGEWQRLPSKDIALVQTLSIKGKAGIARLFPFRWCHKHITQGQLESISAKVTMALQAAALS